MKGRRRQVINVSRVFVDSRDTAAIAAIRRKVRCHMDKHELVQHIPGDHIHTFLFTDDVKLLMADIKPNKWGDRRAKVEAWYGDKHACASSVTLGDPESGAKFIHYASQRVDHIDWYEVLRLATNAVEYHLNARSTSDNEQRPRKWISLPELMAKEFPEVVEVVPGILHTGVTILISSPKLGKTRMMLNIAIAVVQGESALGNVNVDQGDVLYLCLEDPEQLLQERVGDMLQGDKPPQRMDCANSWARFDVGGLADLDEWLQGHPEAKLVVIDIFQRVKPLGKGNRNAYETDYEAVSHLLELGKKYLNVAIVVVHHTNRSKDVEHFIDRVNGSTGLAGGVDGIMYLKGTPQEATLEVTHRRLKHAPLKMAVKTDTRTGGWTLLGDAHQVLVSEERQQIIEIIRQAGKPLSCRVMALELEKKVEAIRKCVQRMVRSGHLVMTERGLYDVPPVANTPVPGVPGILRVPGVLGVLGDSGQEWDRVGQWGCPHLTDEEQIENVRIGQVGQGGHRFTSEPVHDIDQDIAELFDAVDVTPIDDDPPDDMLLTSHDPTADISPAAQEAGFTRRVQTMADTVRPKPSVSPSNDEPPPLDEAYAEARGEQVDDTEEEVF
jgi:hypothetical protein